MSDRPQPSTIRRVTRSDSASIPRLLSFLLALSIGVGAPGPARGAALGATVAAPDSAHFRRAVDHPYFPLVPGTSLRYTEKLGRHVADIQVQVTSETRRVLGIACTLVREQMREKSQLTQETLTGYAQDDSGSVWILFEESREYHGAVLSSTEGSWEAGLEGARAGVVMPARLQPCEPIAHGFLKGVAEDRSQLVAIGESVNVPFGAFSDCLKFKEWSMLESGTDRKWYARGVGLVRAESASRELTELVATSRP